MRFEIDVNMATPPGCLDVEHRMCHADHRVLPDDAVACGASGARCDSGARAAPRAMISHAPPTEISARSGPGDHALVRRLRDVARGIPLDLRGLVHQVEAE